MRGIVRLLMVIFGAGASYDSCPALTTEVGAPTFQVSRPPMTDELFGRRLPTQIQAYPELSYFQECIDVAPHLQKRQGNNFEQYLQSLSDDAKSDPGGPKVRQLVAIRYYLKHLLMRFGTEWKRVASDSNYRTLINDLEPIRRELDEKVILVTFNYDTLLEAGLKDALRNVKIDSVQDYVKGEWPIFKLHGSVNWGRVISPISLQTLTMLTMEQLVKMQQLDREKLLIGKSPLEVSNTFAWDSGGSGLATGPAGVQVVVFPALAIPMLSKDDFELPGDHLRFLTEMIPHVSKVVTIGWRGTEDKFLGLLRDHLKAPAEVLAVSSKKDRAERVVEMFSKARVPMTRYELADGGFTSSLDHIVRFASGSPS